MSRYKDTEKIIRAIKNRESGDSFEFNEGLIAAMNAVDEVPDADVEKVPDADVEKVQRGYWRVLGPARLGMKLLLIRGCSVCGIPHYTKTRYCPNCGAKMNEKERR